MQRYSRTPNEPIVLPETGLLLPQQSPGDAPEWYTFADGRVACSPESQLVVIDNEAAVPLTRIEHRILLVLSQYAGQVVHREMIISEVWSWDHFARQKKAFHNLKTQIDLVRQKLGRPGLGEPQAAIRTCRGVGYMAMSTLER